MDQNNRSITELFRDLVEQASKMIRHEVGLARAEMMEKAGQASSGATMLAMALIFGIGAVVVLLGAAVIALSNVVAPWLAALIVGVIAALLAWAMAEKGKSDLRARNLIPNRTIESVRADTGLAKEKAR